MCASRALLYIFTPLPNSVFGSLQAYLFFKECALMKSKLIHDACHLLQGEISPEAGIHLNLLEDDVQPMTDLLEQYDLHQLRARRLLSIYIAIKVALLRHSSCDRTITGEALTRLVLDGDYLYSLYLQLCLEWNEYDLITHLAPVIKQIQIKRIDGKPDDDKLLKAFELFLKLDHSRNSASKAI
ncbi:hypothetical protein D3C78_777940 [compost metagenome]